MSHLRFQHQFTMSAQANNDEVRVLLGRLRQQLADFGVGESTCASAELVLAEALNNITEHAYADQPGGPVQVCAEVGSAMLRFTLSDRGVPIPGSRLPKGQHQETEVALEDLPEGGFGWLIIREFTKSISYDRQDDENCLVVTLPNTPDE